MPVLCLDTATARPVVAAFDPADGRILAEASTDDRAQVVLELVDDVLARAGCPRSAIEAIVVGTGPGTFTGLRVGIATARGLAETLGVPLHGTSSLLASVADRALAAPGDPVRAVIAAGRGESFGQQFRAGSDGLVEAIDEVTVLAGVDGAMHPTGTSLVAAARLVLGVGTDGGDPLLVLPEYGREPDAEPRRIDVHVDALARTDLDALLELEARCFETPWTRGMYEGEFDRPDGEAVLLAARDRERADRLVGAALAARIGDCWHVMNVLVDPADQRRGIASTLVASLLERTTALGPGEGWTLEVRAGNDAAIGLYARHGFEGAGRRRGYYQDTGEDALVMWRRA